MWSAFKTADVSKSRGKIDYCVAFLLLFFTLSFPVILYRFLNKKFDEEENALREPATKAKYDSIYSNIDYFNRKALYNTSFFMARRLILAFIIVHLEQIVLQVLFVDWLSTLLLAYYLCTMPMVDRLSNFVQILNESVV